MTKLLFRTIEEKRLHWLNALKTLQIVSHRKKSVSLKLIRYSSYSQLFNNHEEAATKVIAHIMEVLLQKLSRTYISQIFTKLTKISVANCSSLAIHENLLLGNFSILNVCESFLKGLRILY